MSTHGKMMWPPLAQVCEAIGTGELLHLRWKPGDAQTMCRRNVANGTMIPQSQWGAADRRWCAACERRAGRPEPLVAARQEASPAEEFFAKAAQGRFAGDN